MYRQSRLNGRIFIHLLNLIRRTVLKDPENPVMKKKHHLIVITVVAALLIASSLCVYIQTTHFDFVNVDDDMYVTSNPFIRQGLHQDTINWAFTTDRGGLWIPFTWLSFMLDYELYGLNPTGFHLTNVIFHLLNVLVLLSVLISATGNVWRSAFVAGLFALHPLHVESVAWITERKDVLSSFFWMLGLAAYVRYVKRPSIVRYGAVMAAFACGLLSKPMAVTFPAALLLFDFWPLKRFGKERIRLLVLEKVPLFVLSMADSAVTFIFLHSRGTLESARTLPPLYRAGNALVAYVSYIVKMIFPAGLAYFYPHPSSSLPLWKAAGAGILLLVITAAVVSEARRRRYLLSGWLWYLITLFPVIGLFQVGLQAMADRFVYMPLIGLYLMVAWGVPDLAGKRFGGIRPAVKPAAVAVLAAFMVLSFLQTRHWRNSLTLNEHAVAVTGGNYFAHTALGKALCGLGRYTESMEHFREAIRANPGFARAYNDYGILMVMQGRVQEACTLFETALKYDTSCEEAHYNLGVIHTGRKQFDLAEKRFRQAIAINQDYIDALMNLGAVLAIQGKSDEALTFFSRVLAIDPSNPGAHKNMGTAYVARGQYEEAEQEFREALRYAPDDAEIYVRLAEILAKLGRPEEAKEFRDRSVRLNLKPDIRQ